MTRTIAILPGDGIGPEVIEAAVGVLEAVAGRFGHQWHFKRALIGGAALAASGEPLPRETLQIARHADAVLLGAVGDPAFDHLLPGHRPESALLELREALGTFANLRPARSWPGLERTGPVREEVLAGTDLIIVRELTGGLYYGQPRGYEPAGLEAFNTMRYTRVEIARVARVAFDLARTRRRRLVSVDKANVLDVSRLWRDVVVDVARGYPDVSLTHEYVDAAAMKLVTAPTTFDVILTENLFGDILSDEAGAVCGSLGVLGSASLGEGVGIYEPVHGSAPALAGRDRANPIGALVSASMLLERAFGLSDEGRTIVGAVEQVLTSGLRTADLAVPGGAACGTREFTRAVLSAMTAPAGVFTPQ